MLSNQLIAVMDAAVDAMVLIDVTGAVLAFNPAAERIFGWPAEEVVGRNVSMLMPEPDRSAHDRYLARHVATGESRVMGISRELQAQRRDGTVFPIHLSIGRVAGSNPVQFVGFIRDVSAERDNEERARASQERLMHVSRMATMGEMAAGIAHEINQPLTAIANYAHATGRFLNMAEPDIDEAREAVREIAAEAMRAGEIIRRLRHLVRGRDDAREYLLAGELIDELRLLTQADARVHDTRLRFDLLQSPQLHVSRIQITQVLLNLIRNALESLAGDAPGSREIVVRCRRAESGDCQIAVCDNGPGVAPQIADRMFDPFLTTKRHGTGLGLPMSQTIAQAHGGNVRHVPVEPRGACFVLTLPATQAETA